MAAKVKTAIFWMVIPAYFRKIPAAIATSFVARLLRLGSSQLVQKCVSWRGGHGWSGGANTPRHHQPLVLEVACFGGTGLSRQRSTRRDRFSVIELLLKGGIPTARPFDPE